MDPDDYGSSVMTRQQDERPRGDRTRRATLLVSVAVLVVAALAVAFVWLRGGETLTPATPATPAPVAPSMTTPSAAPSNPASPSARPSSAASTAASSAATVGEPIAVPVYYVADVEGGPRLYREFHRVPALAGGPVVTALTEMFRDRAVDPDYASMWPAGTRVLSVRISGATATVDLSGFVALGASFEGAAVQQLVYTVTAADPTLTSVKLLVNGATPPSGHIDWSSPIRRADAFGVLANAWILSPTQGGVVSSPVKVTVYGTGWEGNVPLKVFQGETEVASTFVTTMMGGFAEAHTTITLPAGTYELRAYNDNGLDATLRLWDTKTFTVK